MNDYWNDPPEPPEIPECCGEMMEYRDNGDVYCPFCFKLIPCQPDIDLEIFQDITKDTQVC
jgi:hypothetical protein